MADPGHINGPNYIPNCVALRLHWELPNDKIAYNVLHARYTTTPTLDQTFVNNLHSDVGSAFTLSGLNDFIDVASQILHTGVRDMRMDPTSQSGFSEWVSNTAGHQGGAELAGQGPMPPQIALVVSLKTGFAGPANRGRVYIPGWHQRADDGNGIARTDVATSASDFIERLRAAWGGRGLSLSIAHPARQAYTSPKPPFTEHAARAASAGPLVTGVTVLNAIWDTQRLRAI